MKTFWIILSVLVAAAIGWFIGSRHSAAGPGGDSGGRRVLYYQSAMHPWVKSDSPGRCTICGMELTPVYEGEKGFDAASDAEVITLTPQTVKALQVATSTVERRPLVRTLRVSGVIDDDATRHRFISSTVKGRVDRLHANYVGAEVTADEPVAEIFSRELLRAISDYRLAQTGSLRQSAAMNLRQLGLTEAQIARLPERDAGSITVPVLSPISGTVVAQHVYEGEWVEVGEAMLEVADFSTMWFIFHVYEDDLPWVRVGQKVEVTTPSRPGHTFEGQVTFIDPNIAEETRSARVRVELPNPVVEGRRALLHKLFAEGLVHVESPEVLSAPRSAVIHTGRQPVAYVDRGGGAYEQRTLTLGRRGDTHVEVLSGLTDGESVVTQGNILIDGQAEMNQVFAGAGPTPAAATPAPGEAAAALDPGQQEAVANFLSAADNVAAALAADDLAAFQQAATPLPQAASDLSAALQPLEPDPAAAEKLPAAARMAGAESLAEARRAFYDFTLAATALLEPLRTRFQGVPDFQVWQCGMVDQALSGVPPKIRWVQTGDRPGHNPFFGAEMLECAELIAPGR